MSYSTAPLSQCDTGISRASVPPALVSIRTVVGIGMRSHSGVAAELFKSLSDAGINIEMISTSEIKVTVTVAEGDIDRAANVVHEAFGLGAA